MMVVVDYSSPNLINLTNLRIRHFAILGPFRRRVIEEGLPMLDCCLLVYYFSQIFFMPSACIPHGAWAGSAGVHISASWTAYGADSKQAKVE